MQICCTKKLLESISVTPEEHFNIDPLFSWHADVLQLTEERLSCWLMTRTDTRSFCMI